MYKLEKLLTENTMITSAIGATIAEYDITAAAPTAIRYACGLPIYEELMKMGKSERNIRTGLMQRDDPTLWPKIEKITLDWFNDFIEQNKIERHNFIETTRDSILVLGKIPTNLTLDNGFVQFRNKDGAYTSYYRIDGRKILFDSMSGTIRIKGVSDEYVQASPFVNTILKPFLASLETGVLSGQSNLIKCVEKVRTKYIENEDFNIYRDVNSRNLFQFQQGDDLIEAEMMIDEKTLIKTSNYMNYILPIIRMVL